MRLPVGSSYASYATAADEFWAAEEGAGGSVGGQYHQPTSQPQPSTQTQSHSQGGAETLYPPRQHYLSDVPAIVHQPILSRVGIT